jgi:protocatechuate 3,4-dioxygenase beta subunit
VPPTSQHTIGPFFPAGFFGEADHDLTRVSAEAAPTRHGEIILLRGRVTRLEGIACVNALIELWQADRLRALRRARSGSRSRLSRLGPHAH